MEPALRPPEAPKAPTGEPRMSIMGDAGSLGPRLLPVLVAAIALTAIWPSWWGFLGPAADAGRALGLAVAAVGIAFWANAGLGLVRAYREDRLCTTGSYGLCRHPIFAWWIFFVLPPLALIFDSWLFLVAAALVAWAVRPAMKGEEDFLARRYGDAYARYAARVSRLVPMPRALYRRLAG